MEISKNTKAKELSLRSLALPIFFDMALKTLSVTLNVFMVAHVNVLLVGAMSAGNQVFTLFITIFSFLSIGCSVVVAQSLGAKNANLALRAIHISITLNAFLGLVSTAFIYFFTKEVLVLLNVPDEIFKDAYEYLHYMCLALFLAGIGIVVASILRVKNMANYIVIVSLITNAIVLLGNAYVLGFLSFLGLNEESLGLKAVAMVAIVAHFSGLLLLIFFLIYKAKVHIHLGLFFKLTLSIVSKILKVGLPSAGENLLWFGQYMVAFAFIGLLGAASLSVQSIYFQISTYVFLVCTSVSMACEVIVGHLVGARRYDEAYKKAFYSLKIGVGTTWVIVLGFWIFKEQIMDLFDLSGEIRDIMRPLFTLSLILESGRGFNIIMVNSLRATGDARFPFIMGIIFMWGVSLPVGYICGIVLELGIVGVWAGFCVDEWGRAIANTLRWRSRKWQNKTLV
ncbi:MAG: MATE family efflux transporter [Campylobacter sp.]|uniref:MATE family efflux transporter n=1 Tax=Campylobacter sp. TaxID=205 RepID=UPI002AA90C0A|nr:MATE family efflux transporter [Campylobacter sp.]MCI6695350.1 MATE family efflux transporter [Campylobacter sp.]